MQNSSKTILYSLMICLIRLIIVTPQDMSWRTKTLIELKVHLGI